MGSLHLLADKFALVDNGVFRTSCRSPRTQNPHKGVITLFSKVGFHERSSISKSKMRRRRRVLLKALMINIILFLRIST